MRAVGKRSTKHHSKADKLAADRKRLELDEGAAEGHPLQEPAGVADGDQEAVDREDGGLPVPPKSGGEYAPEAAGGHPEGGWHH